MNPLGESLVSVFSAPEKRFRGQHLMLFSQQKVHAFKCVRDDSRKEGIDSSPEGVW